MKEFLVGLVAILVFAAMAGGFLLLLPFFMVMTFFLKVLFVIALPVFFIWLLGKLIVMLFDESK
jgi:hypothetical protein